MYILFYCRTWDVVDKKYQFVLTGIVTGNPTAQCEKRALPDVFNYVGHPLVRNHFNCQLVVSLCIISCTLFQILQWIQGEMRSEFPTTTTNTTEKSPVRWSRWTPCSATCGDAVQVRVSIEGETEQRQCNQESCPPTWSSWSTCSTTCGPGVKTRTNGRRTEERDCTSKQCPSRSKYLFPHSLYENLKIYPNYFWLL